jgi:hypothetical protein
MPDLTNRRFDRLTVLGLGSRSTAKRVYWHCLCSCGTEKQVRSDSLTSGAVRSCGCLWRNVMSEQGVHHKPGERFGRLRVVRQAGVVKKRGRVYLCRCDCGKTIKVQGRHLRSGETQSCGCFYRHSRSTANFRHGQSRAQHTNPVYDAYYRQRGWCRNAFDRQARYYYERGIEFRFASFTEFYSEVGDKPGPDCRLMRIDRDGHFEAGNLHWVQYRKRKRRRRQQSGVA